MKRMSVRIGMLSMMVLFGLVGGSVVGVASEQKVYIPSEFLRRNVVQHLETPLDDELPIKIENELPTIQQMAKIDQYLYAGDSLEGVQYATNATYLSGSNIIDFRPITGMKNLKEYYAYSSVIQGDEEKVLDISPFGKLENLESLYFGYSNIQDFTMLSDLLKLKSLKSYGGYHVKLPTVYVDKSTKKFIMGPPVKYSTQFDGERKVTENSGGNDVNPIIVDNAVIIENLNEGTSKVNLAFEASSKDSNKNFFASFTCEVPIVWY